jgi:betaine-aldehyde dehydrogenase
MKPSELTPLSTVTLTERTEEAGVPAGVVNLVLGKGKSAGEALITNQDVDLISFTGGLRTGEHIMAAAASGVRKVALELGGKNPNIIFADADFEAALDNALTGAFLHSGQVCSAGARIIVEESLHRRLVEKMTQRAAAMTGNPLISAAHREKVERYIAAAQHEGATLTTGGTRPDQSGFYLRPAILDGCTRDMTVVREEVFGPVATIETFTTEDEAIRLGNDTDYGLAGAVWTSDAGKAERVARRLRHGTVWINDYHPYLPQAEWGGFGKSGIGRELGPSGLEEYQEKKHIYHNLRPAPTGWFDAV